MTSTFYEVRQAMTLACFMRYSITAHKAELEQYPGPALRPIIYRDTYEEASRVAREWAALYAEAFGITPDWIHHPHGASGASDDDPHNWMGSWGWKIELRATAETQFSHPSADADNATPSANRDQKGKP